MERNSLIQSDYELKTYLSKKKKKSSPTDIQRDSSNKSDLWDVQGLLH